MSDQNIAPAIHERKYPREWFRVSGHFSTPVPVEFQRETEHWLFTGTRRYKKWTDYDRWYPTQEEAQAVIDARRAEQAAQGRAKRIRDAAPELLEALKSLVNSLAENDEDGMTEFSDDMVRARAAITKAEG